MKSGAGEMPMLQGTESGVGAASVLTILEAVNRLSHRTHWELVRSLPLRFPTYHPQGLAFVGEQTFLSSVQVLDDPRPIVDSRLRTPGRGVGHLFVLDSHGNLVRDIFLGEGDMYHPGGIDFDGEKIWVPLAEYRRDSNSMVLTIDPVTFEVNERFRVRDHIGWVVRDPGSGSVHGGTWGSREFYAWTADGVELDHWDNPSNFIDYQDCQFVGAGRALCSGIATLPLSKGGGEYELGGIAVVDLLKHQIVHETVIQLFSSAGHVVTRNPFAFTTDSGGMYLHVAPDNGTEGNGTEVLTYRATVDSS